VIRLESASRRWYTGPPSSKVFSNAIAQLTTPLLENEASIANRSLTLL
jgi:hypothetical protein